MLSLLIAHIIITACCCWSGFLFNHLFSKQNIERPIIFYLIGGLILLTSMAQIIVLFFPVGLLTQLIVATILLAAALAKWNDCRSLFKRFFIELSSWTSFSSVLFFLTWMVILVI